MTARLFASLFCHGGSCSMAAKPLFLTKVFSKKPKSIIQKGDFEKTSATIFNFFSRFEFSQNEACAYRKGDVRKHVDDRHGWSCVCGRVPCRDRHSGPACGRSARASYAGGASHQAYLRCGVVLIRCVPALCVLPIISRAFSV